VTGFGRRVWTFADAHPIPLSGVQGNTRVTKLTAGNVNGRVVLQLPGGPPSTPRDPGRRDPTRVATGDVNRGGNPNDRCFPFGKDSQGDVRGAAQVLVFIARDGSNSPTVTQTS
jgi:hypothetical protein